MNSCHKLAVAVERYLIETGIFRAYTDILIVSDIIGKSSFSRISEPAVFGFCGIVAQSHSKDKFIFGVFARECHITDSHAVLCESTGLV